MAANSDNNIIDVDNDNTGIPVYQFSSMSINEFSFFNQDEPMDYFDYSEQNIDNESSKQVIIIDDDCNPSALAVKFIVPSFFVD